MTERSLSWIGIFRLGIVQTMLGSIVVLATSTMNRVMIVELALPAMLPGIFVGLHYAIQILRPRWGYSTDVRGYRTPWIVGGVAVLAVGGILAALATAWMETDTVAGIVLGVIAFLAIGIGVGASGTNLLVLLATHVAPRRRAAAASITWMMMIAGFVVTATAAGEFLDPFSSLRLVEVTSVVCGSAFVCACLAVWRVEAQGGRLGAVRSMPGEPADKPPFLVALRQVWGEPKARRFAVFVLVAMLAYSAQDLVLEPFAGTVFGMTPGESTKLAGVQHGGVLLGMLVVAIAGSAIGSRRAGSLRLWAAGGCVASALALFGLAAGGLIGGDWPLRANVFALGVSNGVFAVAAIGSMMGLAGQGIRDREGVRMGIWGAAQAIAFGLGGFAGTFVLDVARAAIDAPGAAYSIVFALEAVLFVVAALLCVRLAGDAFATRPGPGAAYAAQSTNN